MKQFIYCVRSPFCGRCDGSSRRCPEGGETFNRFAGLHRSRQTHRARRPKPSKAQFDTTRGKFTIEVTRSLSPNGADRFYNLVHSGYFKDVAFFRVIPALCANSASTATRASQRNGRACGDCRRPRQEHTRGTHHLRHRRAQHAHHAVVHAKLCRNINLNGMGFSPFWAGDRGNGTWWTRSTASMAKALPVVAGQIRAAFRLSNTT